MCTQAHYEKDVNPYTEILERLPDAIAYANKQDTRDSGLMDLQAHEEPCGLEDEALVRSQYALKCSDVHLPEQGQG